jgi:hypothetical protein
MNQAEVDARALTIAAAIMAAAGLCRHEAPDKCKHQYPNNEICAKCIKAWIKNKAKQELRKEART